jgi:hypothetical protein
VKRLHRIRSSYPQEFHRVITSFKHAKALKAVELRKLREPFFSILNQYFFKGCNHFLYLHLAVRVVCSPTMCKMYSHVGRQCFQYFTIFQFGKIYGSNHLVYNVHSITHLVDDCPLDSISAFPFAIYLTKLGR